MSDEGSEYGGAVGSAHGCAVACYSGGPGEPYYQPYFKCTCGWSVRESSWEDAGAEFDAHLAETDER